MLLEIILHLHLFRDLDLCGSCDFSMRVIESLVKDCSTQVTRILVDASVIENRSIVGREETTSMYFR